MLKIVISLVYELFKPYVNQNLQIIVCKQARGKWGAAAPLLDFGRGESKVSLLPPLEISYLISYSMALGIQCTVYSKIVKW